MTSDVIKLNEKGEHMRRRCSIKERNQAFIMGVAIGALLMAIAFVLREVIM